MPPPITSFSGDEEDEWPSFLTNNKPSNIAACSWLQILL